MRDYAELVKALRNFNANFDSNKLTNDAADAIEELLITTSAQKETIGELRARNSAQADMLDGEWISVEERLPEKDEMVIVYYSWIGQSGTEYKEVSLATLEEMRYCGNKLLGWMPLPEPPKEELNKNVE